MYKWKSVQRFGRSVSVDSRLIYDYLNVKEHCRHTGVPRASSLWTTSTSTTLSHAGIPTTGYEPRRASRRADLQVNTTPETQPGTRTYAYFDRALLCACPQSCQGYGHPSRAASAKSNVCPPEELPRASPSGASCCCYVLVFLQRLFATFSSGKFVVGPVQVQARFQGFTRETDHRSLLDYLDHSREYLYVAAHVTG